MTAVDNDVTELADLSGQPGVIVLQTNLEDGSPWPLPGRIFSGIVVTNYLWRALLPTLVASVAPGGSLIYETFAAGNERFGRPSNPNFLLDPGELLEVVRGKFEVRGYEHGEVAEPRHAIRQRIAAVRL